MAYLFACTLSAFPPSVRTCPHTCFRAFRLAARCQSTHKARHCEYRVALSWFGPGFGLDPKPECSSFSSWSRSRSEVVGSNGADPDRALLVTSTTAMLIQTVVFAIIANTAINHN